MTKMKAFIVEDDAEFVSVVSDIFDVLGHDYDVAECSEEARQMVLSGKYDYYIVDLEIPLVPGKTPRIQNGEHVIEMIDKHNGPTGPPILVVTGHGQDTCELAARAMRLGAVGYITKPLSTSGQTLDQAILDALKRHEEQKMSFRQSERHNQAEIHGEFCGGQLVLEDDEVLLDGVTVSCDNGYRYSITILEILSEKSETGHYLTRTGKELAERIDHLLTSKSIWSSISNLRKRIVERLQVHRKIKCGTDDVIEQTSQGYRLRDWINVVDRQSCRSLGQQQPSGDPKLSSRQRWILAQLSEGVRLRRADVERQFRISGRTAKRELGGLCTQGRIIFVRRAKPGYYRPCDHS